MSAHAGTQAPPASRARAAGYAGLAQGGALIALLAVVLAGVGAAAPTWPVYAAVHTARDVSATSENLRTDG
jgi:hypothetical protein